MNDREKDLQAEELADLARRLETALRVESPDPRREKALFVAGVAARRRARSWVAALVPATAVVAVLVVLALVSRTAQPGQALYPVREVLRGVGLAPSTAREIRADLDRAERLVTAAASSATSDPERAKALALSAMAALDHAETLADELEGDRRDAFDEEIDTLEERADDAYDAADDALDARDEGDGSGRSGSSAPTSGEDDDSSGPGSGGDDDSSGSGSDDSGGDDSSGSGSDDSGGDDSSGPGSGGDDDSSGSGSGGDDSSGSGSGGDDDSSGPGSGGDDD